MPCVISPSSSVGGGSNQAGLVRSPYFSVAPVYMYTYTIRIQISRKKKNVVVVDFGMVPAVCLFSCRSFH